MILSSVFADNRVATIKCASDTSSYIVVAVQTACNVIKTSQNTNAEVTMWMRWCH